MPAEPASSIVHALKYEGWAAVADDMAERMSRLSWPPDVVEERTALVPIPLASARKRQRGYNQSALIASGLGARWRIPVWEDAVVRCRETVSQTRLTPEERLDNVAGSFRTSDRQLEGLRGAHVVIVDDVVTTAATLNTCAKALYESGARIISYVTFGRAHASGDRLVAGSFRTGDRQLEGLRGAHVVIVDDVVTTAATLNTCAKVLYESGARIISYVTFGRAHASGDRL